jgi:hypothetical protein
MEMKATALDKAVLTATAAWFGLGTMIRATDITGVVIGFTIVLILSPIIFNLWKRTK